MKTWDYARGKFVGFKLKMYAVVHHAKTCDFNIIYFVPAKKYNIPCYFLLQTFIQLLLCLKTQCIIEFQG